MRTLSVLAIASVLFIAPVLLATNNNVFAQNSVTQGIGQLQLATQLGICLSGVNTFISCNNLSNQEQTNFGNNVAGQQGGSGSGNTATQGIGQAQSVKQGAVCVSGDGTFGSCNNLSNQEQTNFGNNVAGQQGGSGYKGGSNTATQGIGQAQSANQGSLCVSGGSTSASCNNLSNQEQTNFGNNVAGQQGGSGYKGGSNTATQGIGQAQSANQRSLCVSGDDTSGSCNNLSNQEQTNFGNNVAGQQGGSSSGGSGGSNTATQGIGQSQSTNQGSLCVSGGSTSASCNNFNSQTQTNYGNNVIGQSR